MKVYVHSPGQIIRHIHVSIYFVTNVATQDERHPVAVSSELGIHLAGKIRKKHNGHSSLN